MNWTQPICGACFDKRHPGRRPVSVVGHTTERCCDCGNPASGVYIRIDPRTVNYPAPDVT